MLVSTEKQARAGISREKQARFASYRHHPRTIVSRKFNNFVIPSLSFLSDIVVFVVVIIVVTAPTLSGILC